MGDDFIERAEAELQELRSMDAQLEATLEGLRRRRGALVDKITVLEEAIDVYRRIMGLNAAPESAMTIGEIPMGSITEMSALIIARDGGEASVSAIARELGQRGKLKGDQRANYATVYGTLRRDKRFEALGQGRFTLRGS